MDPDPHSFGCLGSGSESRSMKIDWNYAETLFPVFQKGCMYVFWPIKNKYFSCKNLTFCGFKVWLWPESGSAWIRIGLTPWTRIRNARKCGSGSVLKAMRIHNTVHLVQVQETLTCTPFVYIACSREHFSWSEIACPAAGNPIKATSLIGTVFISIYKKKP